MLSLLLTFTGCNTIDPPNNPPAIDDDGDGYTEFEGDCDDRDPNTFPGSVTEATSNECMKDDDGDGFGDVNVTGDFDAGTDCDDSDALTFPGSATEATSNECMKDDDGDGFGDVNVTGYFDAGTDCDDSNPLTFPGAAENESDSECLTDEDEDGWSAESGDCDDGDVSMPNQDWDCDGVLSVDDCDDNDASLLSQSNDMDCDGVLSSADCDDADPSSTAIVEDSDCDGVLNVDDCDDSDASTVDDMDCDGVLSVDDCDDNDASLLSQSNDMDCDGVLSSADCDDSDSSLLSQSNDMDCDGVITWRDCDDANPASVAGDCEVYLDLGGGWSMDLVQIPSGSDPQGRYTITSDFYLMTTEVTQGMFYEIMGYQSYSGHSSSYGAGNDYPAYYVNWHMAADFANKVTQRHNSVNGTSLQQCYHCSSSGSTSVSCTETVNPYQCSGYVLPTEAEWEYAARSGTQYDFWTSDGGGNYNTSSCSSSVYINDGVNNPLLSDYGWFCGNASSSKEVGQKLPNGFGLYDMHGNLYEWTADWWGCSFPQASTDPYCSTASSYRVGRGGFWSSAPSYVRASGRSVIDSTYRYYSIGFRLGLHP